MINEELKKKIEDFLLNATAESILKDCEDFGIELEDIEPKKRKPNQPPFFVSI